MQLMGNPSSTADQIGYVPPRMNDNQMRGQNIAQLYPYDFRGKRPQVEHLHMWLVGISCSREQTPLRSDEFRQT